MAFIFACNSGVIMLFLSNAQPAPIRRRAERPADGDELPLVKGSGGRV